MYLGPALQIRPRTLALLVAAGALLIAAGRSEAASLAAPAGAAAEAELIIRGQVAELRLRGLDAAGLRQRLAGATPRVEIHLDGQRLLVAELAELRFAEEAPAIRAAVPALPGDECLGLGPFDALDAALRTSSLDGRPGSATPTPPDAPEAEDAGLRAEPREELVPVPEPSTAPLLGAGLLGLLLLSRRR